MEKHLPRGPHRPLLGWYGDDFTGATDTLASLSERGLRAVLFLRLPSDEQLSRIGPLDALGIAGASRTMTPTAMKVELPAIGAFFSKLGVKVLHYKCCSTFDSAPHVGSIGAAVALLRESFSNPFVPIVGGQPNLGRYCLFGNLFAAAGTGGEIVRIDRHPTMGVHPVTPMAEADLRRHLAVQGLDQVGSVDYRAHALNETARKVAEHLSHQAQAVLLDVAREDDLPGLGRLMWERAETCPMLAVGASSVAQALAATWPLERNGICETEMRQAKREGSVFCLVGSLSPVARAQVEASTVYDKIILDIPQLLAAPDQGEAVCAAVLERLRQGKDVMAITSAVTNALGGSAAVALATSKLVADVVDKAPIRRLVIAGGDTSSIGVRALNIWALSFLRTMAAGVALCRAHSDDAALDGMEIVLKGGQMGPVDLFDTLAWLPA